MRANCWVGKNQVEVQTVPDPQILNQHDAIVRVSSTAICGSDLHLFGGFVPTMQSGDILGHEFMGEVVEIGRNVRKLKIGDRVVVPFTISCGTCFSCKRKNYSLCENSNPNGEIQELMMGHAVAGAFGYSHMTGGFAGGQAEYVRVPFADVGPLVVPKGIPDDTLLFLSDVLPTGYMAAEMCDIEPGDTVAVWGAGPVGMFSMLSARLLGAERVIAIDEVPYRLRMAAERVGAIPVNFAEVPVLETLATLTGGMGPDKCIDAVGMEANGHGLEYAYDRVKQAVMAETDRPIALREAILSCRSGGVVSVPGVYAGLIDKVPMGAVMNRALTIRTGQTHVHRYMKPLLDRILAGEIDPTFIITHRMKLEDAPLGYDIFRDKKDNCEKVVLSVN